MSDSVHLYERLKQALTLIALASSAFAAAGVGALALSLQDDLHSLTSDIQANSTAVTAEAVTTAKSLRSTLDSVQGTVADVGQVAQDVHYLSPQVGKLIKGVQLTNKEAQYLILQAGLTTRSVHTAADKEVATLDNLNAQVKSTLDNTNEVLKSTHDLVADPNLHQTLDNIQRGSKSAAGILQDGKDEADKLVHPPKAKLGFWGGVWLVCQKVHSMLPPIF
jgi:uncharacterized protein YoxC